MSNKIDFKDTAFIIPFQASNFNRVQSLSIVLYYLLNNFDTNIYLKEIGGKEYIDKIIPFFDSINLDYSSIKYFNDLNRCQSFPKTKILNDLLVEVEEKYVVMNDADCILPLMSYVKAKNKLANGLDFVIPFSDDRNCYWELNSEYFFQTTDNLFQIFSELNKFKFKNELKRPGPPGGINFLRYESYINGYMENENFAGYGPEDAEKVIRFKRLGFKVDRIHGLLFHLAHEIKNDDKYRYINVGNNEYLMNKILSFNDKELIEYYQNQNYFSERKKILKGKII